MCYFTRNLELVSNILWPIVGQTMDTNIYSKYKKCLSMMMPICKKQHLSNTWNSIHEKVRQHWRWLRWDILIRGWGIIMKITVTAIPVSRLKQVGSHPAGTGWKTPRLYINVLVISSSNDCIFLISFNIPPCFFSRSGSYKILVLYNGYLMEKCLFKVNIRDTRTTSIDV